MIARRRRQLAAVERAYKAALAIEHAAEEREGIAWRVLQACFYAREALRARASDPEVLQAELDRLETQREAADAQWMAAKEAIQGPRALTDIARARLSRASQVFARAGADHHERWMRRYGRPGGPFDRSQRAAEVSP